MPTMLAGMGLAFAALALITPWFAVDISHQFVGGHYPLDTYSLTEYAQHNSDGTTKVVPYELDACHCPSTERAFSHAQLFAWTGALLAAFAFWSRGALPQAKGALILALTAVAGVMLVAGPVLLALEVPQAFNDDHVSVGGVPAAGRWGSSFTGSFSEVGTVQSAWGPAIGWVLALLGGALTLAAVRRDRGPVPAEAVPAPSPARAAT